MARAYQGTTEIPRARESGMGRKQTVKAIGAKLQGDRGKNGKEKTGTRRVGWGGVWGIGPGRQWKDRVFPGENTEILMQILLKKHAD